MGLIIFLITFILTYNIIWYIVLVKLQYINIYDIKDV